LLWYLNNLAFALNTHLSVVGSDSMLKMKDVEAGEAADAKKGSADNGGGISATGFKVLVLLAVQNCSKNLIMRYAVKV